MKVFQMIDGDTMAKIFCFKASYNQAHHSTELVEFYLERSWNTFLGESGAVFIYVPVAISIG